MNVKTSFSFFIFVTLISGVILFNHPIATAQNNWASLKLENSTENSNAGEKSYILIFGQRTIGNIDNSTKIVTSIVGHNIDKITEECVEEIRLAPTQQLEEK